MISRFAKRRKRPKGANCLPMKRRKRRPEENLTKESERSADALEMQDAIIQKKLGSLAALETRLETAPRRSANWLRRANRATPAGRRG